MSTALQLVNRSLARVRENKVNDSGTFTSRRGLDMLEFVEEAKRDILETRIWEFDRRHDRLYLHPQTESTVISVVNDLTTVGIVGIGTVEVTGEFETRLIVTEDSAYGNTSFPLDGATNASGTLVGTLRETWKGTTFTASGTGYLFNASYLIPRHATSATNTTDTKEKYRQILSVTHQERPLKLVFVGHDMELDRLVPRRHDSIGSDPRVVYVGGRVRATRGRLLRLDRHCTGARVHNLAGPVHGPGSRLRGRVPPPGPRGA